MDKENKKKNLKALLEAVQRAKVDEENNPPGESPHSIREPAPGEVIGDFKIIREIGRGGMGVIFEAEQLSLHRQVALKVLYPALSSSVRTLRRFHRESEAVAKIKHNNIIPVWAVGASRGLNYFAMRYLPGPNLAELIEELRVAKDDGRRTLIIDLYGSNVAVQSSTAGEAVAVAPASDQTGLRFSVNNYVYRAIELIANIADGLAASHERGVIHRDVKPGNLVFDSSGQLVLTDFGIAKSSSNLTITRTGEFIGSPGYISPEQAMAKRINVDHRTDIYSLGVTLYEFLTLHQPFLLETLEATLRAILTKQPESPRKLNPRLPKDIETVVLKAMDKDPDRRFASAMEFAGELRRILNFEAISSTPPGALTKAARIMRHNRSTTVASLAIVTLLIGSLAIWQYLQTEAERRTLDLKNIKNVVTEGGGGDGRASLVDTVEQLLDGSTHDESQILLRLELVDEALARNNYPKATALISQLDLMLRIGLQQSRPQARMYLPKIAEYKIKLISGVESEMLAALYSDSPQLGKLAKSRSTLAKLLSDRDSLVAKNAAVSLGRSGDNLAVAALFDAIYFLQEQDSSQLHLRADFVEAIGLIDHQSAFEALLSLTQHDDPSVCREAVRGLFSQSDPRVTQELERISKIAKDAETRMLAERFLTRMKNED